MQVNKQRRHAGYTTTDKKFGVDVLKKGKKNKKQKCFNLVAVAGETGASQVNYNFARPLESKVPNRGRGPVH